MCELCHDSCLTCNNATEFNCTSCNSSLFLRNDNSCLENCTAGYYGNIINNTCLLCNSNCLTCFNESEYNCSSCFIGLFLNNDSSC